MRIGIVDDQAILRDLLAKVCREHFGYEVVVQADAGLPALAAIAITPVDLIVLDLMLPDIDGFEGASKLKALGCAAKILAMSSRADRYALYRIEEAGFSGFLHKNSSVIQDFQSALTAVNKGEAYFSPIFFAVKEQRRADPLAFEKLLTPRQQKILCMLGDLLSDQEIAARMHVSQHAIEKQRFRIMKRLNLSTRNDLQRYARGYGFFPFSNEWGSR